MAKLASLMEYYYEKMYPDLKILESGRLEIVGKIKKAGVVIALLGLGLFFTLSHYAFSPLQALGFCAALGGMLFAFIYQHHKAGYDALFKDNVIEKIVHFIDPSFVYRKDGYILESEYQYCQLLPQSYDRYRGSDLVEGVMEGVGLHFSDLHVEEKRHSKNNKEEWHTLFKGLFFVADFHKTFEGRTYVLPDVAERSLGVVGSWLQGLSRSHGELIKLDHVQFEKYFVVYGDDPVEAHYLLSHAFMERVVVFYEKHRKNLFLGFVGGKMYLALGYTKALFEPKLTRSLLAFTHIKEYFEILEMVFGIVEVFRLDQKLWSKR